MTQGRYAASYDGDEHKHRKSKNDTIELVILKTKKKLYGKY